MQAPRQHGDVFTWHKLGVWNSQKLAISREIDFFRLIIPFHALMQPVLTRVELL